MKLQNVFQKTTKTNNAQCQKVVVKLSKKIKVLELMPKSSMHMLFSSLEVLQNDMIVTS